MRRLFASLSALLFLGSLVGCNHTCGLCDCDPCSHSCCCSCAGMGYQSACGACYVPTAVPSTTAAPVPMPKVEEKKPDEKKPDEKKPDEKKPDEKKPDEKPTSELMLPSQ